MKIAFTSVPYSGVDSNVRMVSRWLVEQGHTVHILYNRSLPDDRLEHPHLHYHLAWPGNLHYYAARLGIGGEKTQTAIRQYEDSLANARMLQRIRAAEGLDLAELNDLTFHPRLLNGLPFIYKMHGADWLFSRYCEDSSYATRHVRRQYHMMRAAAQVHVVSRSQADFVAGACRFPPRLIHVTPNPIYTHRFHPASSPPRPGPPYYVMAVGRLEPRKGHHILVAAMRKVWEAEPEAHLYLHKGASSYGLAEVERLVPESEHRGRIHFVGYIPEETLIENYRRAHVYVTAARYETFGYTILEAMACGRPVIASDIGPIPELVRHEETGWLVPRDDVEAFAEAIVHALRHPEVCERYGQQGRKLAERFDIEPVMARQMSLYERALADQGVGASLPA